MNIFSERFFLSDSNGVGNLNSNTQQVLEIVLSNTEKPYVINAISNEFPHSGGVTTVHLQQNLENGIKINHFISLQELQDNQILNEDRTIPALGSQVFLHTNELGETLALEVHPSDYIGLNIFSTLTGGAGEMNPDIPRAVYPLKNR